MTLISTSGTQNEFALSNIERCVVLQVMSSAWWKATGEYKSLSEQQILDCSWDYGWNHACDGGDPDLGIKVGARGLLLSCWVANVGTVGPVAPACLSGLSGVLLELAAH